jgi:hypothetical protein
MRCWLTTGATRTAPRGSGAPGATIGAGEAVVTGAGAGIVGGGRRVKTRPKALAGRAGKPGGGAARGAAVVGGEVPGAVEWALGVPGVEVATRVAAGVEVGNPGGEDTMAARGAGDVVDGAARGTGERAPGDADEGPAGRICGGPMGNGTSSVVSSRNSKSEGTGGGVMGVAKGKLDSSNVT